MTKRTARKKASANNHFLGKFIKRNSYYVAWCEKCGAACFAEEKISPWELDAQVNPALERACL